ncbi:hypothetical protein D3C87_1327960 [compost metagenome]
MGDSNNFRISRVELSSGAFAGWVGYVYRSTVGTSPTSPVQTSGTYTNNWTTGGVTEARSTNGFGQINSVIVDSTSNLLYVTDNQHRVTRIRTSDGLDLRWIGRAGVSPTGGYTGCSSTPISGTNPGWCLNGGGARYGNTNGTFLRPLEWPSPRPNFLWLTPTISAFKGLILPAAVLTVGSVLEMFPQQNGHAVM